MKRKHSFGERFRYWFDNRMSRGTLELIRLLTLTTIAVVLLVTGLVLAFGLSEEGGIGVLWESYSTVINAWMPSFEDGEPGYVLLMSLAAISGLLVTSVLIGIISSAIEEKINNLKSGNSRVLEHGHTVVLGFVPGEYTLLQQLILAAGSDRAHIVLAGDLPRDEMEELIRENLTVPKNVRIICRTVDLGAPASIAHCAITESKGVIVNVGNDAQTLTTLLAVSRLIEAEPDCKLHVGAIVSDDACRLPEEFARKHHIIMLHAGTLIARIIAHASTEPGISGVLEDVLNFDGYDMYSVSIPEAVGMSFEELSLRMDEAVPLGIFTGDQCCLNPEPQRVIAAGEEILIFAREDDAYTIRDTAAAKSCELVCREPAISYGKIGIIGINDRLKAIVDELPDEISSVALADIPPEQRNGLLSSLAQYTDSELTLFDEEIGENGALERFVSDLDHVIILSRQSDQEDEDDLDCIMKILKLREIRERDGLNFNITAEMHREANQRLVSPDDGNTDFVVASNVLALFLAQLAEGPQLYSVFRELLSNEGNELYIRSAAELGCVGSYTVAELRQLALQYGCVLLGYLPACGTPCFDLKLDDRLDVGEDTGFVVLDEEKVPTRLSL